MASKFLTSLLLLVALISACGPADSPGSNPAAGGLNPDREARIAAVEQGLVKMYATGPSRFGQPLALQDRMAHYRVPGVSIAVIENFELDWAKGYGVHKSGQSQEVTPESLFHAGSIAKTLAAAATLALVEAGSLDLDRDVNEYLVTWRIPDNEYTDQEKVTLRRLMSHSAGIKDGFTNRSSDDPIPAYIAGGGRAPTASLQQLLDGSPGLDLDGATRVVLTPGSKYHYANADYAILELVLVDVTGQPAHGFLRATILDPLAMNSSTFLQPLPEAIRNRATVEHDRQGLPFPEDRGHFPMVAAGGLWTTPSDLARFAIELMRSYQGESDEFLTQESVREMFSPQIDIPGNPLHESGGLGFHLSGAGENLRIMHGGNTWGSAALLIFFPETGQGAVVMTNSASSDGLLPYEIMFSIANTYHWPGR